MSPVSNVAVVAIGRNEGDRLIRCLDSVCKQSNCVVYVDSGSTDGSVAAAKTRGVEVVDLDMTTPFTMARGRNAGFERLARIAPKMDLVMFIDGDCELAEGWLETARRSITDRPDVGAVCGRRRELHPNASMYNRLADMGWDAPVGEIDFAGGDVVMRTQAFRDSGGYAESMIAGEDPEICVRLRRAGWRILRLDKDATFHDAAMTRFAQWWRRSVRSGYAYADGAYRYRRQPERLWRRQHRSNWAWGVALPLSAFALAWWSAGWSLLLLLAYPLWMFRVTLKRYQAFGDRWRWASLYGTFCMVSKVPLAVGQTCFLFDRWHHRRRKLIEYKEKITT